MSTVHIPVLLNEILDYLNLPSISKRGELMKFRYLDGTLGGAGHAQAVAKALDGKLEIIALDRDKKALEQAKNLLVDKVEDLVLVNEDFRNLDQVLDKHSISQVDRILFDLGFSRDELDRSGKGFSFNKDEPLLMTLDDPEKYPFVARDVVNGWNEEDLANVIYGYGEDRFARRIARAIVRYRTKKKIETSGELSEIVSQAVPTFVRRGRIHPATKTFQALRIVVNDELDALRQGLSKGYERLIEGGRMAVISFHSLEDRIVKDFFRKQALSGAKIITKKPVRPSQSEIDKNPASRSAKLRVIEKGS